LEGALRDQAISEHDQASLPINDLLVVVANQGFVSSLVANDLLVVVSALGRGATQ
jgi:hypothetical protein